MSEMKYIGLILLPSIFLRTHTHTHVPSKINIFTLNIIGKAKPTSLNPPLLTVQSNFGFPLRDFVCKRQAAIIPVV